MGLWSCWGLGVSDKDRRVQLSRAFWNVRVYHYGIVVQADLCVTLQNMCAADGTGVWAM